MSSLLPLPSSVNSTAGHMIGSSDFIFMCIHPHICQSNIFHAGIYAQFDMHNFIGTYLAITCEVLCAFSCF